MSRGELKGRESQFIFVVSLIVSVEIDCVRKIATKKIQLAECKFY